MVKPSSMGAIYTDTSAYRRNNRIDSAVKQLSDEMNTVKQQIEQSAAHTHTNLSDTEFKTHIATTDNNFSIDNVITIANLFSEVINRLNWMIRVINVNKSTIIKQNSYSKVIRPIIELKYGSQKDEDDFHMSLYQFAKQNITYFYQSAPSLDDKYLYELDEPYKTIFKDLNEKFYDLTAKFISDNQNVLANYNRLYNCLFGLTVNGIDIHIQYIMKDLLDNTKYVIISQTLCITKKIAQINSYDTIPSAFNTYLRTVQDVFNSYQKIDYDPLLGTIYQFGLDENFNKLLVVSSQDYPQWKDKRIVDSYIPGSNIDMPGIIYQINVELNRNYTGMSEGEIVLVQYAVGATYYTGVVKMLKIDGYDGLCYQIQNININEILPNSVSMTGDVGIQGNFNVTRYNGETVINTDNTRKIVSFHDKIGINQQPYEVEGLLDIDNLTHKTILDLFADFVPFSVNSYDVMNKIIRLDNDSFSNARIIEMFKSSGGELFDYKNQVGVISIPIKAVIDNNDITIINNTVSIKDILVTTSFLRNITEIILGIRQMEPEIKKSNDPDYMFSFMILVEDSNKLGYILSLRAIIRNDTTLLFTITNKDVSNLTHDKSYYFNLVKMVTYFNQQHKLLNLSGLLLHNPEFVATQQKDPSTFTKYLQNNEYFSSRFDTNRSSEIFCINVTALDFDTNNEYLYLINEFEYTWVNRDANDLYAIDLPVSHILQLELELIRQNYNNRTNSVFAIHCIIFAERRALFINLLEVGDQIYMVGSGITLNDLLSPSLLIKGDNTLTGNLYVKDSNNNTIFKVDNVDKTIANTYKVGVGTDYPKSVLDVKDTTIHDILSQLNAGTQRYNILNKIAARLRDVGNNVDTPFDTSTDFKKIIDDVYTELSIEQTIDNFARLYELNMDTMLVDDIVVLRQWLFPEWDGKKVGDIQDNINKFSLDVLKQVGQSNLNTQMIYDNALIVRFYRHVFGWKKTRMVCLEIKGKMYLLAISTNVQKFGLRPDTNNNITTLMNNTIRGNFTNNRIYCAINSIIPTNNIESINELRRLNLEYNDIKQLSFILTIDINDINNTKYQELILNDDYITIIKGKTIKLIDNDEYNMISKYKNFWVNFNKKKYHKYISKNDNNIITYEDLYSDFVTGFKCTEITDSKYTLLCLEMRIQDIIKPSLSVEGDAKITGDLIITNKSSGENFVSIDPDVRFIGIGTDERFINYSDMTYSTTDSVYSGRHNFNVLRGSYPVIVGDRIQENAPRINSDINIDDVATDQMSYFSTYSAYTAKRTSRLYTFDEIVAYAEEYHKRAVKSNDKVTHLRYGPDMSFEVRDANDRTVEIGQLQMVIDRSDNGALRGGFGVQVNDPDTDGTTTFETSRRNLMYVDNDSQLFVQKINLNGGVFTTDDGTTLFWNGKQVVTKD